MAGGRRRPDLLSGHVLLLRFPRRGGARAHVAAVPRRARALRRTAAVRSRPRRRGLFVLALRATPVPHRLLPSHGRALSHTAADAAALPGSAWSSAVP